MINVDKVELGWHGWLCNINDYWMPHHEKSSEAKKEAKPFPAGFFRFFFYF
jgi:hypothetical protein